jgi:hypothetical protein
MGVEKILDFLASSPKRVLASVLIACIAGMRFPRDWWMDGLYRGVLAAVAVFSLTLLVLNIVTTFIEACFGWAETRQSQLRMIRDLSITEREFLAAFVVQGEDAVLFPPHSAPSHLHAVDLLVLTSGSEGLHCYELSTRAEKIFKQAGAKAALKGATGERIKQMSHEYVEEAQRDRGF